MEAKRPKKDKLKIPGQDPKEELFPALNRANKVTEGIIKTKE
jgi:hypothetical protein